MGNLDALGNFAREREEARAQFEADPANAALLAPLTPAEQARLNDAVLGARSKKLTWMGSGAVLAAAAAIFLLLRPAAPLAEYSLEVPSLGYSAVRGEPAPSATLQLSLGMRLEVILRPARATAAPQFQVWQKIGTRTQRLNWSPTVADLGAARFEGEVGREFDLPVGPSSLFFVIGADLKNWAPGEAGPDVQVFQVPVDRVE